MTGWTDQLNPYKIATRLDGWTDQLRFSVEVGLEVGQGWTGWTVPSTVQFLHSWNWSVFCPSKTRRKNVQSLYRRTNRLSGIIWATENETGSNSLAQPRGPPSGGTVTGSSLSASGLFFLKGVCMRDQLMLAAIAMVLFAIGLALM